MQPLHSGRNSISEIAPESDHSELAGIHGWRALYRCADLREARAVATSIAAMEFDVRLCSNAPDASTSDGDEPDIDRHRPDRFGGEQRDSSPSAARFDMHGLSPRCCSSFMCDDEMPGPYVIEVAEMHLQALADVLSEIIAEQREFDQALAWRREHTQSKLIVVLSVTTAAEVLLIWRLLEN